MLFDSCTSLVILKHIVVKFRKKCEKVNLILVLEKNVCHVKHGISLLWFCLCSWNEKREKTD